MQRIALIGVLLAALTVSATVGAKIYKWSDDRGQIHYGELPPMGQSAQIIDIQTLSGPTQAVPSSAASSPETAQRASGEGIATEPERRNRPAQAVAQRREQRRHNCQAARHNLKIFQAGGSSRRFRKPSGEVVRYTQAEQEAKIAAAKRYLEQHCQRP